MVTCLTTSRRWTWVPPEVHTNTGRLCSAGSRCHPVPRRPRSYAALRLPAPISHGSGSPCRWLTSMRALVLCPWGADDTCARHVPCVGDGSPALRSTGVSSRRGEGLPGYGAILFVRAMVEHPAGYVPLLAHVAQRTLWPSGKSAPWASGKVIGFGAACPMAHTFACLRIAGVISGPGARLATGSGGLTLGRAGFAPAGRRTKFHEGLVSSLPFDQHCLVALIFLYSLWLVAVMLLVRSKADTA
jgi:hypothetical protein